MSSLFRRLLLGIILGVAVYAAGTIYVGASALAASLATFSGWVLLPVLALSFTNYLLRYLKWTIYLRTLGIHVPRGRNLTIFLGGLSMTVTPGKIGELLKAYLLKRSQGVAMARTAPVVLAERVTDLIGLVVLMAAGVLTFQKGHAVIFIVGGAVALFVAVVSSPRLAAIVIELTRKVPGVRKFSDKLDVFYQSTKILFTPKPLFLSTVLSVLAWFCECVGFWLVLGGFDVTHVSILLATFIYSTTTLGGLPTPGGIGLTEGSMTAFLRFTAKLDKGTAAAATLIIRFCTLWFAVFVGSMALLVFRRQVGLAPDVAAELKAPDLQ